MSARASTASPSACSGDRYSGVPKMTPACVSASPPDCGCGHLRDAEVEDLDDVALPVALDQHDVLGLEVAMDDAGGVRVLEPAQDLAMDRERPRGRHRPGRDRLGQRLARQELHHQEQRALGRAAEVGDGDDVRVREPAGRLGLALEAARELFLAAQLGQQHLDREIAPHHRVLGAVHGAHAADADAADDAVALTDGDADERVGDGPAAARTERVLQLDLGGASSAARHRQRAPDVRASAGAALGGWTTAMTSRFGSRTARAARTTSGAATLASAAVLRR